MLQPRTPGRVPRSVCTVYQLEAGGRRRGGPAAANVSSIGGCLLLDPFAAGSRHGKSDGSGERRTNHHGRRRPILKGRVGRLAVVSLRLTHLLRLLTSPKRGGLLMLLSFSSDLSSFPLLHPLFPSLCRRYAAKEVPTINKHRWTARVGSGGE